ncbi:radical SAM-associated putative lipoprotein [Dysgonomonas sp. Marseille-P4677]|uniref:radical SAM-associated putative lipoprotein n=1 Tax=Dysgonomonas sp. Marseille-P4677 TaxID=2364790 RepID=UPI001912139D|nr:radical SAM-associated putative lipoprotein [Dysgonomonas sp. Marseille-P4677]MBK5722541.1 radical SAM-associated putative lipoprotein [Dysgonomonas sp. Marseille-P4677]
MKKGALSLYSKIISFFMLLLGYTACEEPAEYGTPSADYKVLGKVVSAEGEKEAVEGIRVVMIHNVDESKVEYIKGDTTYTNAAGSFEIKRKDYPGIDFKIKFQDVDGEANGEFEEKIEIIDFKNAQYEGGDKNWYDGETTKDMGTIELEVKKAPEEE